MSATANLDALSGPQQGQFHPSIKPTGPMMDQGVSSNHHHHHHHHHHLLLHLLLLCTYIPV